MHFTINDFIMHLYPYCPPKRNPEEKGSRKVSKIQSHSNNIFKIFFPIDCILLIDNGLWTFTFQVK